MDCHLRGESQVPPCMKANGVFLVLIPCLIWNGKLFIGGHHHSVIIGEISTGIAQILLKQTSQGSLRDWTKRMAMTAIIITYQHAATILDKTLWESDALIQFVCAMKIRFFLLSPLPPIQCWLRNSRRFE